MRQSLHARNPMLSSPDRAEQGTVALLLQGLDGLLGQSNAILLELVETSVKVDEGEVQTQALGQGLEDLPAGGDDLAANAVTGQQTCRHNAVRQRVSAETRGVLPIRSVLEAIVRVSS